jgi:O6-methylguanine-DNA--protein-cysteine methyltransferase
MNKNPYAPEIPCHRVVKGSGELGGFASGPKKKTALLRKEGVLVRKNRIVDFKKVVYVV